MKKVSVTAVMAIELAVSGWTEALGNIFFLT